MKRILLPLFLIFCTAVLAACAGSPGPSATEAIPTLPPMVEPYYTPTPQPGENAYPALPPTAEPYAPPPAETPSGDAYPSPQSAPASPYPAATDSGPGGPVGQPPKDGELPADVLLRVKRSGGIAGMSEVWTLHADGSVEYAGRPAATAGPAGSLPPERVSALMAKLEDLGFFKLKQAYGDPNACCDMIFVTIEARSGDTVQSVTYNSSLTTPEPGLAEAIEAAMAAFEEAKK